MSAKPKKQAKRKPLLDDLRDALREIRILNADVKRLEAEVEHLRRQQPPDPVVGQ